MLNGSEDTLQTEEVPSQVDHEEDVGANSNRGAASYKLPCLLAVWFATGLATISAIDMCGTFAYCEGVWIWTPICYGIANMLAFVAVILAFKAPAKFRNIEKSYTIFMLLWFTQGVICATCQVGPFTGVGSGWVSVWVCFVATVVYLAEIFSGHMHGIKTMPMSLCIICFASLVLIFATIDAAETQTYANYVFACLFSGASFLQSAIMLLLSRNASGPAIAKMFSIYNIMFWFFAIIVLTSAVGPFPSAGTGFIMSWAAFFASVQYLIESIEQLQEKFQPFVERLMEEPDFEDYADENEHSGDDATDSPDVQIYFPYNPSDEQPADEQPAVKADEQ
jgi:hypothetical protein